MKAKNVLTTNKLTINTSTGRTLIKDLNMSLGYEQVVIIGRNGVGKSTLIETLAKGNSSKGIVCTNNRWIVYQSISDNVFNHSLNNNFKNNIALFFEFELWQVQRELSEIGLKINLECIESISPCLSQGELRKLNLVLAKLKNPELLLLDEPTEDLDHQGRQWLFKWLKHWKRGLIIISHNQSLMRIFENFFIVAENGCRYFNGNFSALESDLIDEDVDLQRKYINRINNLNEEENRSNKIIKRRKQKKAQGRLRELGRMTPKVRLNWKRGYAQESQGRVAKIRNDRIEEERLLVKSERRQLKVNFPLQLSVPKLSEFNVNNIIELNGIKLKDSESDLSLVVRRQRIAITGSNGAGKTSLLKIMMGLQKPAYGSVYHSKFDKVAYISQGAENWSLEESLLEYLMQHNVNMSEDEITSIIITSKFPIALGKRPMNSLSHGERVRAALICILAKTKESPIECLVLDEPTISLDTLAVYELKKLLNNWTGALVVVSHEDSFLHDLAIEKWVHLSNGEFEIQS
jgi:ATPase subunit of ABC transporter with duplicated ATPase domains